MSESIKKLKKSVVNMLERGDNELAGENCYIVTDRLSLVWHSRAQLEKCELMRSATREYVARYGFDFEREKIINEYGHYSGMLGSDELALLECCISEQALWSLVNGSDVHGAIKAMHYSAKTDFSFFVREMFAPEALLETTQLYCRMDARTKSLIRDRISEKAKKTGMSVYDTAADIIKRRGLSSYGICSELFCKKRFPWYFILAFAAFLVLAVLSLLYTHYAAFLTLIPLLALSFRLSASALSSFLSPPPVLRMEDEYAEKINTLVCITTLLTGNDGETFHSLEKYYCANRNCNCVFAVLADLPPCRFVDSPTDEAIVASARNEIERLNKRYGAFALFIRRRTRAEDNVYSGRERKRGAVEDLVLFMKRGENAFFVADGDMERVKNASFILTLDSDTRLTTGSVAKILTAASHPYYAAQIENGVLVKGFGAFQPRMASSMESASKSAFAELCAGSGGLDVYESAAFSVFEATFGEGVFCGKGLINVDAYDALVTGALPEKQVLSHDIPEGALLHTFFLSDTVLTDSTPRTVLSFFRRAERWARGDIQNLFLFGKITSPCGRWAIIENALRVIAPVFSLFTIALCAVLYGIGKISSGYAGLVYLFAVMPILLPPLVTLLASPSRIYMIAFRRSFAHVMYSAALDFSRVVYELISFPMNAFVSASASVKALWRMTVSRKKLLEWVTASQYERAAGDTLGVYICGMLAPAVFGTLMFFITPGGIYRLSGALFFLFPIFACIISKKKKKQKRKPDIAAFRPQAERIYAFFANYVTQKTNYLPPDNVSIAPVKCVAMRTSPTNIGMYLLALAAAADFGLIDEKELAASVGNTFDTLDKLKRWNGHFYNWYDISSMSVIGGEYVSFVDSGNFVCSLIALAGALKTYGQNELSERAKNLAQCNFSVFYDKDRSLFALGCDGATGKRSEICYDLYMSEARSASYVAVANCEVPAAHWNSLARTLLCDDGYIGMASWTGTAFEYFMPCLFLPVPENSFLSEALSFAYYQMRKHPAKRGGIWGISECAFYAFDSAMNYQYRAFGIGALGLKHYTFDEPVVSPYSTYLMMSYSQNAAKRNFDKYRKLGMYGKYGFYESYDFSLRRSLNGTPVKCYMAHHMGMSLAALANFCFDDVFVRRFMNDIRMESARELLEERIPEPNIFRDITPRDKEERRVISGRSAAGKTPDPNEPECALLTNGSVTAVMSDSGHIRMQGGKTMFNAALFRRGDVSCTMKLSCNGECITQKASTFEISDDRVTYVKALKNNCCRVSLYLTGNCCVAEAFSAKQKSFSLDFIPVFDQEHAYLSHPAFSMLFLSFWFEKESGILFIKRSFRDGGEVWGAVACGTDAYASHYVDRDKTERMDKRHYAALPMVHMNSKSVISCRFFITCAETRDEARNNIQCARESTAENPSAPCTGGNLLRELFFENLKKTESCFPVNQLWRFSVSGDRPLLFLKNPSYEKLVQTLLFFRTLAIASVRIEMLILVVEADSYGCENDRTVKKALHECACEGFLGRRDGIYVCNDMSLAEEDFCAAFCFNGNEHQIRSQSLIIPHEDIVTAVANGAVNAEDELFDVYGGTFGNKSYTVRKAQTNAPVLSWVISGRCFGCVVTQSSLGFTFFSDSRNGRLSYFPNDSDL
ncbi:MAG TPA: glucoamylase family protein, partial [Bacillota bacterium]|nr:glucoamylase family protein [Bacillota bacterium]